MSIELTIWKYNVLFELFKFKSLKVVTYLNLSISDYYIVRISSIQKRVIVFGLLNDQRYHRWLSGR